MKDSIDFGNQPIGIPPTPAQQSQLRNAFGIPDATTEEMQQALVTDPRSMSPANVGEAIAALGGASQRGLTLLAGSGTGKGDLLGYSVGPTAAFVNFPDDSCNPLVGIGGGALATVSFSSCGYYGFTLYDTAGLTSTTSLSFSSCGYGSVFLLTDTSGLTAVTSLSFDRCGYNSFNLLDTAGLTSLTTLSFDRCGIEGFDLSDTSGFIVLNTLSFSSCGQYGFSIYDTSGFKALTSLSFSNCGSESFSIVDSVSLLPESVGLLILNAIDNGSGNGTGPITLHVTGISTLQTVKSSLEGKGYTVTLTTPA